MLPTGAEPGSSLLSNGKENRLSQLTNGVYPCAGNDEDKTKEISSKYSLNNYKVDKCNGESITSNNVESSLTQCTVEKIIPENSSPKKLCSLNQCASEKCLKPTILPKHRLPVKNHIVENGLLEHNEPLNQCKEKHPCEKNSSSEPSVLPLNQGSSEEEICLENDSLEMPKHLAGHCAVKSADVEAPEKSKLIYPQPCPPSPSPSPHKDLSSPEECWYNAEMDSGHSTAPSPDTAQSSPQLPGSLLQFYSSTQTPGLSSGILPTVATHRGLVKFIPRHADEVQIFVGDPIFVQKECTDLWFEGINLRTSSKGVFPRACVKDVRLSVQEDFEQSEQVVKERYVMDFLGSVEVTVSKGNDMLCQAIEKVSAVDAPSNEGHISCILEICELGIRVVNCKGIQINEDVPDISYYFNLQNVTFCGYHPNNERHFAFVTKHPSQSKFACHVFDGGTSTHHVADVVGVAFQKLLERFVEATSTANPSVLNP